MLLAVVGGAREAQAQGGLRQAPVQLAVDGLFGDGTLLGGAWVPVEVPLRNRTARDLSGTLRVVVRGMSGSSMTHEARVDLPPRAERSVTLPIFAAGSGEDVIVQYLVDDRVVAGASTSVDYSPAPESVVVLGDPPRLRAALTDLDVELPLGPSRRQVRMPIGTITLDPATSDPRMPERAVEWASVRLFVASIPVLERASEAQRAAVADWVRAGGRVLLFPRSAPDLARPWLTAWIGATTVGITREPGGALAPDTVPRFGLACTEAQRVESFGCSTTLGFGRVYVADYDGTTAAAIATGQPRELVRSVVAASLPVRSALAHGRGADSLAFQEWSSEESFGRVRRALDPNEGFRPALGLVALVLFLYVILVGPLNFRWVQRRGSPVLALVTTPAAALGCLALLLGVGYVGKGVLMRYRRVEVIESVEGETRALSRRYTGLYSTRPGSYDLEGPRDGLALRVGGAGSGGPVHRHHARGITLADVRAGLWETVFLREDRHTDLRAGIRFERDGRRLASVVNESGLALHGAFVLDPAGEVYLVGEVPAGATRPIAQQAAHSVTVHLVNGNDTYHLEQIASALGLEEEDHDVLGGVVDLMASRFVPDDVPVLYARVDGARDTIARTFDAEEDHVFVRVAPRMRGAAILPAPAPLATDQWGEPTRESLTEPEPVDAGVPDASPINDPFLDAGAPPSPTSPVLEVLGEGLADEGDGP